MLLGHMFGEQNVASRGDVFAALDPCSGRLGGDTLTHCHTFWYGATTVCCYMVWQCVSVVTTHWESSLCPRRPQMKETAHLLFRCPVTQHPEV